jgi:O-methyltransferase involved in polyketide biosynthesis
VKLYFLKNCTFKGYKFVFINQLQLIWPVTINEISNMVQEQKDFTSISPSAKSLLMLKGYTDIPYARQMAALAQGAEVFDLTFNDKNFWFWIRVMHFESRYRSIDQLLKEADSKNILEVSSGYSLRGVDLCREDKNVHYIDTDLPEIVALKQRMIADLQLYKDVKGTFELLPLNAMDVSAFNHVIGRFENQPFTIINEGLLMYLDLDEKRQLCKTIHTILKQFGGYWITADVYVKRPAEIIAAFPRSKSEAAFFEKHNIEENKFESYEAAEGFFKEQGFELVKEAVRNYEKLSVMPHLLEVLPEAVLNSRKPPPKIQATWMLKAI